MPSDNCAACGRRFEIRPLIGAFNTFVREKTYESSLYGSQGVGLCASCHEIEEQHIDLFGTNDIPELLASYVSN